MLKKAQERTGIENGSSASSSSSVRSGANIVAETASIGQSRLPQSTSQDRIGKKIIRPNAINNASKHFPKDFFNHKDRVKKKREGAGTSEHCNRQRLGRSTINRMTRPFRIPEMAANDLGNNSMSLEIGRAHV